jgi:hypothetical protein
MDGIKTWEPTSIRLEGLLLPSAVSSWVSTAVAHCQTETRLVLLLFLLLFWLLLLLLLSRLIRC